MTEPILEGLVVANDLEVVNIFSRSLNDLVRPLGVATNTADEQSRIVHVAAMVFGLARGLVVLEPALFIQAQHRKFFAKRQWLSL